MASKTHKRVTMTVMLFLFGVVILFTVISLMTEGPKLLAVLDDLEAGAVFLALVCMAISYASIALSFSGLFQLTDHKIPFGRLCSITFISTTFNFIISTGGLSSLAVRAYLFKQDKVSYSTTVPLSVAQSMITNLVLSLMCLGGLLYLHRHQEMIPGGLRVVILAAMVLLVAMVVFMALGFFNKRVRHEVLERGIRAVDWISQKVFKLKHGPERLREIYANVESSVKLLHQGWLQLLVTLFWVTMDWFFTAFTLYFCFRAVDVKLQFGMLLVGFAVAFLTSTINILPAGLGVTEGSLAVVFTYFGVQSEKAVVAALLFRIIYFIIPLAASAALYLDTMRTLLKAQDDLEKKA